MPLLLLSAETEALRDALAQAGLAARSEVVADMLRGMKRLEEAAWDVVFIDADLGGGSALELVEPLAAAGQAVVVLAAAPTLQLTLRSLRSGAREVLPLPPSPRRLQQVVEVATRRSAIAAPAADVAAADRWQSVSPALADLFATVARFAEVDAPLLVWGETGTGKALLSRAIHEEGARGAGPFVSVNCGALPETVLDAELFGRERGLLAGGQGRRIGRVAKAAGGTLLLEEVSRLTPRLQLKVLRLIREREYENVGGSAPIAADVRLIATADEDPLSLLQSAQLVPDLYYALAGGTVRVPPLRDRGEADLRLLAQHFLRESAQRYGRDVRTIGDDAWAVLLAHPWPGNTRQLRGALERAVIAAGAGTVHEHHLPDELRRTVQRLTSDAGLTLEELEKRHIVRMLELTDGHLGRTAQLLGIHRNTLRRKLVAFGIDAE